MISSALCVLFVALGSVGARSSSAVVSSSVLPSAFSNTSAGAAPAVTPASAWYTQAKLGQPFTFDTDGNNVHITNDHVEYDYNSQQYIWLGNDFTCGKDFCGIRAYTSPDFQQWTNQGYLFDPTTSSAQSLCAAPLSGNCGRPKVLYNAKTSRYVLYLNAGAPGFAVYTSTSPTSGYRFEGRSLIGYQPPGHQGGDFTLRQVGDDAYIVYSSIDFTTLAVSFALWPPFKQALYLQKLTPDYLNTTGSAYPVRTSGDDLVDEEAESPELFVRKGLYYVLASNTCGFCNGTLLVAYRSKSIQGPWTRQIVDATTCDSQLAGVTYLPNDGVLMMADTHSLAPPSLFDVRTSAVGHLFRQLKFNGDGSIGSLQCGHDNVNVQVYKGKQVRAAGDEISASVTSSNTGDYRLSCDLNTKRVFQSLVAPSSGTLKSIGVTLAGYGATAPVAVSFFAVPSSTFFQTPFAKFSNLFTSNVAPADLPYSPDIVTIPGNGTSVTKGQRYAIELSGSGVPACYLQKTSGAARDHTLYIQGNGQQSLRGPKGTASPIFSLPGQEIKFQVHIA